MLALLTLICNKIKDLFKHKPKKKLVTNAIQKAGKP